MGTSNLRKFFADDKIHTVAARVVRFSGEASHFFTNEEKNIVVSVETHHHGMPMWANLNNTNGVWTVPPIGTEVLLASDMGDIEGEVYIIGTYGITNTQNIEAPTDVNSRNYTVIVDGNVSLTSASGDIILQTDQRVTILSGQKIECASEVGNGAPAATLEDIAKIWAYLTRQFDATAGHQHKAIFPALPVLLIESTIIPPTLGTGTAPEPVGTDVLLVE